MWLQPSFFWIGLLQFGQGFELVTSQRQLAASSLPLHEALSSSGLISAILICHSCHCLHPQGACASPKHSQQKKCAFPQSTAWEVIGADLLLTRFPVCSASGNRTARPQPAMGHHLMLLLLSTKAYILVQTISMPNYFQLP